MESITDYVLLAVFVTGLLGIVGQYVLQARRSYLMRSVEIIDRKLGPLKAKYGKPNASLGSVRGRVQASLQLAYYGIAGQLAYAWRDGSYTGLYQLHERESRAGVTLTIHMRQLRHSSPHLYFDDIRNNSVMRKDFPRKLETAGLIYFEGFVSDRFKLYAPPGYALDALVIGAPDVLDAINQYSMGADIEILGDQLYLVFPGTLKLHERLEELLESAKHIADAVDDNLARYIDDRARGTGKPVSHKGQRLVKS